MIKMTATSKDGVDILILALSHANLDKLREDGLTGFIKVVGKEIGLPVDVIITAGPTEAEIAERLAEFIGPNTKVNIMGKKNT